MATPAQKRRQVMVMIDEMVNSMDKNELLSMTEMLDKKALAAAVKKALELILLEKYGK